MALSFYRCLRGLFIPADPAALLASTKKHARDREAKTGREKGVGMKPCPPGCHLAPEVMTWMGAVLGGEVGQDEQVDMGGAGQYQEAILPLKTPPSAGPPGAVGIALVTL